MVKNIICEKNYYKLFPCENVNMNKNTWKVIDLIFKSDDHLLTRHHLDSYETFIRDSIKKTIKSMNPFPILKNDSNGGEKHQFEVYIGGKECEYKFSTPERTPLESRLYNKTYECDLIVDIVIKTKTDKKYNQEKVIKDVVLCKMPIMLHSSLCMLSSANTKLGECPYDKGGYFIVDGKEKVILSEETTVTNRLFINKIKDHDKYLYQAFIECTSEKDSVFPKTIWFYVKHNNAIVVKIPQINNTNIPLFLLFRALGVESDKQIIENYIGTSVGDLKMKEFLRASVIESCPIYKQEEALEFLKGYVQYQSKENVLYLLLHHLFPNIDPDLENKAILLGELINQIVQVCLGRKDVTNRDNYMYKRINVSGKLISDIFKDFYNDFRNKTRSKIDNMYEFGGGANQTHIENFINESNAKEVFSQSDKMMYGLVKSLKSNWGLGSNSNYSSSKDGIVQDLNRISYMSFISHLRRVLNPMDTAIKIRAPHQLNGSQWGVMCPCESPDGASIGLTKNMSILCKISHNYDSLLIKDVLKDYPLVSRLKNSESVRIEINNNFYAYLRDDQNVNDFVNNLKHLRRTGKIDECVSIVWSILDRKVNIMCDSGRCCRPLIYNITKFMQYKKGNSLKDIIEYIDVEEANNCLISFDYNNTKATHWEIHPTVVLSAYTSTIPLSNHNQAPRNIFSGAQGKQAIGVYATNFSNRIDTLSYILHYPQSPLVATNYHKYLNADVLPNGENVIVAIATYTGYNQEDSIIINKASIERGLFNITYYTSHVGEEKENIEFGNPTKVPGCEITKYANYTNLDNNGIPIVDRFLQEGDAILGKIHESDNIRTSKSDIVDKTTSGFVDKVVVFDGFAKIRMRQYRIPELGDKLASRHGQKGVIGAILPHEMMPFTKDGIVPDIIINPHAFPTRMTIAHLIEAILAKAGTVMSSCFDATPFENYDFEQIYDKLEEKGLNRYGDELMYNGVTGEQINTKIFITPTYYYRLKHMVADKINYRSKGKVVNLTKQPTKGRSNEGGLRIGEMETNAIISHGISSFLKESIMERADKYNIDDVSVPYAYKLLKQELESMCINVNQIKNSEQMLFTIPEFDENVEDYESGSENFESQDV